jgi:hypothetical protein
MSTDKTVPATDEHLSESMQSQLQKLLEQERKRPEVDKREGDSHAVTGRLEGFDPEGYPKVAFTHNGTRYTRTARSTVELKREDQGRECLIQLCGDPDKPVISGLIQPPLQESAPGDTAIIQTEEGIRLQSGDAYIELTAEGTVRIRGDYVESVSYGANRLKGASVKIN